MFNFIFNLMKNIYYYNNYYISMDIINVFLADYNHVTLDKYK